MTSQSYMFNLIRNLQEIKIKQIILTVFLLHFKKKTKLHILYMLITSQVSRGIRSELILVNSCLNKLMEITNSSYMFKIQEPLTHLKRSLEPFKLTSMKDHQRQGTQECAMSTSSLIKSQITSHQKSLRKVPSFLLSLLQQSAPFSFTMLPRYLQTKETWKTYHSGAQFLLGTIF